MIKAQKHSIVKPPAHYLRLDEVTGLDTGMLDLVLSLFEEVEVPLSHCFPAGRKAVLDT